MIALPLYIREEEVSELLNIGECMGVLRDAFRKQAEQGAAILPRSRIQTEQGTLNTMAATINSLGVTGTKTYYANKTGVTFVVLLFSTEDAKLLAVIEADKLGQIRTGAMSGLMTDIMAPEGSNRLACAGSGYQAETQIEAVASVRKLESIVVYSRNRKNCELFASSMSRKLGVDVVALDDTAEFVKADILVTATTSKNPVVPDAHISKSCHINAIGANRIGSHELEPETVCSARAIVVDSIAQAKLESGDLSNAFSSGCLDWSSVSEVWEAVSGRMKAGRDTATERTLFKSLGIALEDVAVGKFVFDRAVKQGLGTWL